MTLIGDGLASPEALRPTVAGAGLQATCLVVATWETSAEDELADRLGAALVGVGDGVVYTVSADPAEVAGMATALGKRCGYSAAESLAAMRVAVQASRHAFEMSSLDRPVVGPETLITLDGLLHQQPPERLEPYVTQLITPLVSASSDGSSYLATLRAFLHNNRSVDRTAVELAVHANTVRHRLGRIRQLTGRDPLNFADLAALAIALWAHDRVLG